MDVNEWMSYECSDEGTHTQNIRNSSTRSHASEEEIALEITAKISSVNGGSILENVLPSVQNSYSDHPDSVNQGLKADFQSSHEAPRMHEHFHPITMVNS